MPPKAKPARISRVQVRCPARVRCRRLPVIAPFSSTLRILLLAGINLPRDARLTNLNRATCVVWHSAKLKKLIGTAYAAGTTQPGTTTAEMQAERARAC